jgi:phage-related protein
MSDPIYWSSDVGHEKPLVWIAGEIRTPPFSSSARVETGGLLRRLQRGENLSLPHSRPMPVIGKRCHELRVRDATVEWRIVYRVDLDAVVILEVFAKKTGRTPKSVVRACRRRLDAYDREVE